MNPAPIEIAVALLCRRDGRTLVVRKRGTTTFLFDPADPGDIVLAPLTRERFLPLLC